MRPQPFASRRTRGGVLATLVVTLTLVAAGGVAVVVNLLTLTRDAAALRRATLTVAGGEAQLRVQGSVGPLLLAVVRQGLRFVPDMPDEARAGLAALRGGSVAVHELAASPDAGMRAEMIRAAVAAMTDRGWVRVVAVAEGDDTVLVFMPADGGGARRVRVCTLVCSGRDFIVTEARVDRAELLEVAARLLPEPGALQARLRESATAL